MRSEKAFLESVKTYIEQTEVELDTHSGSHRSLETMIRMNIMPPLYAETIQRLELLKRDPSMTERTDA